MHNAGKPPGISFLRELQLSTCSDGSGHDIFVYTIWRTLKSGTANQCRESVNVANNVSIC